jgi:mxaD protein
VKTFMTVACASLFLISGSSWAAATPLAVTKTVTVNAPASQVWAKVKDFNGFNNWHPAIAKDDVVEGDNNKIGAVRLLTLKDGGTIKEKLLAFNANKHTFKYSILEGVLPVSDYTSTITVKSAGKDKSTVTWSGRFKRKNTGAKPGDNENDKTALDTMSAVYQAGLDNLKKISETK